MIKAIPLLLLIAVAQYVPAQSPEIAKQQQAYKAQRDLWDQVRLPQGATLKQSTASNRRSGQSVVTLQGKNMTLEITQGIKLEVDDLNAFLTPTKQDIPVTLNDISTFNVHVNSGELLLSPESMNALFNRHVLNYPKRPLRNVKISADQDVLKFNADMQLKSPYPSAWINSDIESRVFVDNNGVINIALEKINALKLPVGWGVNLLNLDMSYFVDFKRQGVELSEQSIKLDLSVFPEPKFSGNLTKARVSPQGLHLTFTNPDEKIVFDMPPVKEDSFLWLQSGDIKIADMIVQNGHLQAISLKEGEKLLYHLYDCREQISQGRIRITERGDLIALLPRKF